MLPNPVQWLPNPGQWLPNPDQTPTISRSNPYHFPSKGFHQFQEISIFHYVFQVLGQLVNYMLTILIFLGIVLEWGQFKWCCQIPYNGYQIPANGYQIPVKPLPFPGQTPTISRARVFTIFMKSQKPLFLQVDWHK